MCFNTSKFIFRISFEKDWNFLICFDISMQRRRILHFNFMISFNQIFFRSKNIVVFSTSFLLIKYVSRFVLLKCIKCSWNCDDRNFIRRAIFDQKYKLRFSKSQHDLILVVRSFNFEFEEFFKNFIQCEKINVENNLKNSTFTFKFIVTKFDILMSLFFKDFSIEISLSFSNTFSHFETISISLSRAWSDKTRLHLIVKCICISSTSKNHLIMIHTIV